MTQRIFDIENEKDYADLWNILPHNINRVMRYTDKTYKFFEDEIFVFECSWLRINWHDKTEITRPIQEATEQDIGKLCIFWNDTNGLNLPVYKVLFGIKNGLYETFDKGLINTVYTHARRLTKQEIEELC